MRTLSEHYNYIFSLTGELTSPVEIVKKNTGLGSFIKTIFADLLLAQLYYPELERIVSMPLLVYVSDTERGDIIAVQLLRENDGSDLKEKVERLIAERFYNKEVIESSITARDSLQDYLLDQDKRADLKELPLEKYSDTFRISKPEFQYTFYYEVLYFVLDRPASDKYFTKEDIEQLFLLSVNTMRLGYISLELADEETKKLVTYYGHTIFNEMPNIISIMDNTAIFLKEKHRDTDTYKRFLKGRNQVRLVNLMLKIIGEKDVKEIENKNIKEILMYLEENQSPDNATAVIDYSSYTENLDVKREGKNAKSVFLILWNLWNNASKWKKYMEDYDEEIGKSKPYEFYIRLFEEEGKLAIAFKNKGVLPEKRIKYLLSNVETESKKEGIKGLQILKEKMDEVGWTFLKIDTSNKETEIIILTNQNNGFNHGSTNH